MRCWSYFFLIIALAAQTQTSEVSSHDETPTFQSKVNLVRIPVVVRDKSGRPVGGLLKSDFRLIDSGKPQEIAQFAVEGSAVAKPAERQPDTAIPGEPGATMPTRFVAYVFDDVHLTTDELANVRIAALKHVEQGIPPQERVGILTLSGNVSLELTNDVTKFRETLAKIAAIPTHRHFPPATFYSAEVFMRSTGDEAASCTSDAACNVTCDAGMPPVLATQSKITVDCLQMCGYQTPLAPPIARSTLRAIYNEGAGEVNNAFRILNNIVRLLGSMPGDRVMILVSPGVYLPDDLQRSLSESIDRATRSGVIINTLDARGVYTFDPSGGVEGCTLTSPSTQQAVSTLNHEAITGQGLILRTLADSTGGTAVSDNDFLGGFNRLANPPDYIYYLGFYPRDLKPDGKFHEIKVTLASGQPLAGGKTPANGLSVQARKGYWAPSQTEDAASAATREIGEAVFSSDDLSDLALHIDTDFFKSTATEAKLKVVAHLDVHQLNLRKTDDRNRNDITVVCALFDSNGNYLKGVQKVVELRLKDGNIERLRSLGLTTRSEFDVKPGTYMVRAVARGVEGGQMATAHQVVNIP